MCLGQVYRCVQEFFMTSLMLYAARKLTQSVQYTAGQRNIGLNLLSQGASVYFANFLHEMCTC